MDSVHNLPHVLTGNKRDIKRFIRAMYSRVPECEYDTWEETFMFIEDKKIENVYFRHIGAFGLFMLHPTRENFDSWYWAIWNQFDEIGFCDNFNISPLFQAVLFTNYRSLTIADEGSPIIPFDNVADVPHAPYETQSDFDCPRAFATVVLGLSSLHASRDTDAPTFASVAAELSEEAEILREEESR
jgi:hypothetical protein